MFTPFLVGLLVAGVFGHWVFLVAFALWTGALICVSRADMLNTRARGMEAPSAGLLGAQAGWLLVGIVLILGSGVIIRLVLGAA